MKIDDECSNNNSSSMLIMSGGVGGNSTTTSGVSNPAYIQMSNLTSGLPSILANQTTTAANNLLARSSFRAANKPPTISHIGFYNHYILLKKEECFVLEAKFRIFFWEHFKMKFRNHRFSYLHVSIYLRKRKYWNF